jgi:glycerol-3-phosphate cytidylyltransferase
MEAETKVFEVGYASGVFDLFHVGHLNLLRRAREECETLVVGVVTDELTFEIKGASPVIPLTERLEIVNALAIVDEVIVDRSRDKRLAWQTRPFDVIFKGNDWQGTPKGERLEREMAEVGAEVVYFPYTMHTASSLLRAHITRFGA